MTLLPLNLLIALAWCAVAADFSPPAFLLGFLAGFAALYAFDPSGGGRAYHRRLLAGAWMILRFVYDLVVSNVQVARAVIFPSLARHPGFVEVELGPRSDVAVTLIANLTTLTPGTLTVDVSPDGRRLLIHAMFAEDRQSVIDGVKLSLEPRVARAVE